MQTTSGEAFTRRWNRLERGSVVVAVVGSWPRDLPPKLWENTVSSWILRAVGAMPWRMWREVGLFRGPGGWEGVRVGGEESGGWVEVGRRGCGGPAKRGALRVVEGSR